MNLSKRLMLFVFFLLFLLVGMLFWPFILREIIQPVALVVWVLLRIFVLSLDQQYYWATIIVVAAFFLFRRILPPAQATVQYHELQNSNATLGNLGYWHSLFALSAGNVQDDKALKKELAHLLLLLYATKKRTAADFRLYDALRQGEIPLPEHIRAFVFPQEPPKSRQSLKRFLLSIPKLPPQWMRRWTGREAAEHYQLIDEVLGFIETSLEIKDDDGKYPLRKH